MLFLQLHVNLSSWEQAGSSMEKKKWIAGALKKPGALRKSLHVKEGEKISEEKLKKAENSKNPKTRKRAILAETLKKMHKK